MPLAILGVKADVFAVGNFNVSKSVKMHAAVMNPMQQASYQRKFSETVNKPSSLQKIANNEVVIVPHGQCCCCEGRP